MYINERLIIAFMFYPICSSYIETSAWQLIAVEFGAPLSRDDIVKTWILSQLLTRVCHEISP